MAFSSGSGSGGLKSEINVTPLVDVVLVLLIIFMVVTPMLQRGKDVKLPGARKHSSVTKEADPLILSITADRQTYVEQDFQDPARLERRLRDELAASPGRKVLVKGDQSLTFGEVRRVMNVAKKAGAKGVSLAVEEK